MSVTVDGLQVAEGVDILKDAGPNTAVGFQTTVNAHTSRMTVVITAQVRLVNPLQRAHAYCSAL